MLRSYYGGPSEAVPSTLVSAIDHLPRPPEGARTRRLGLAAYVAVGAAGLLLIAAVALPLLLPRQNAAGGPSASPTPEASPSTSLVPVGPMTILADAIPIPEGCVDPELAAGAWSSYVFCSYGSTDQSQIRQMWQSYLLTLEGRGFQLVATTDDYYELSNPSCHVRVYPDMNGRMMAVEWPDWAVPPAWPISTGS
jgi:hypothetical protein